MEKNKYVFKLLTFILTLIVSLSLSYFLYRKFSLQNDKTDIPIIENNDIENVTEEENNSSILDDNKIDDNVSDSTIEDEIITSPNDNPISNLIKDNNKTTNSNKNSNKQNNSSNKNNVSSSSSSSSNNKKQNDSTKNDELPKEVVKEDTSSNQTATTDDKKENTETTKENTTTEKSIEIIYEVPDISSLKNDPEYIRLMKSLFETFKECDAKGDEVRISDMDNILTSTCEAFYYKGAEIGWKLRINYVDGTSKYYKK